MKKSLAELIDSLTIVNIKIFLMIEKVENVDASEITGQDAKKIQALNRQRSELMNAISKEFKEREIIKV